MSIIKCTRCGEVIEVPPELSPDGPIVIDHPYYCDACDEMIDAYLDDIGEDLDGPDDDTVSAECALGRDGGTYFCGAVGSEQCDECPNSVQIGRKRWYTPMVSP